MKNFSKDQRTLEKSARAALRGALFGASIIALASGSSAAAQSNSGGTAAKVEDSEVPVTDETAANGGEIIVTGSRVSRSGFTAPTPTTIIGEEAIEARGATNIATVLNEIPAFRQSTTPATNSVRSIFPGSYYADLRGLGSSRTLVLVDGNRFVPQITTGLSSYQVDLNQVPSLMIERAEVVTGGASAQWGSDAVGGVVNLILKHDFEGINAEAQYGISEYGDNEEVRFGLLAGTRLGDRAHLVLGFDYVDNKGVGDVYTRDWNDDRWYLISNPCPLSAAVSAACPTGGNGQATRLIVPDVRFSTATLGGLINKTTGGTGNPLRGIQFGPGGTLQPFVYGNYVSTQYMQGGGSNEELNFNDGVFLAPASERKIGYGRFSYDVGDNFEVYAEGSYAWSRGRSQTLPARNESTSPILVKLDNAFIPGELSTIINNYNTANPATPITGFQIGRYSLDLGRARSQVENETQRFVAGFNGDLGNSWRIDGALTHGKNDYVQQVFDNRILANFNFAADAVLNAQGVPVCRATLPGPSYKAAAAGCVPMNLFGNGSPSEDAQHYVMGDAYTNTVYKQSAANINLTGEPFSTWAGPVSIATGTEWRKESQMTAVDPIAEAAGFESTNAGSLSGKFDVVEGYFETVVPLAKNMPFLESLELNGAARVAQYSTAAGTQVTWKGGATWRPIEDILVRVARSRDIRAPNIFELNSPEVSTIVNVLFTTGVKGGPSGSVATENRSGGNADLQPEKADTLTVGMVFTPSFIPGLSLSADYFDITVGDAIGTIDRANIAQFCINGDPFYCNLVTVNPPGSPSTYTVRSVFLNLAKINRRGVDFALNYRKRLDAISENLPGAVTLSINGTYWDKYRSDDIGLGYIERAGEASNTGTPRLMTTSSLTYDLEPASVTLQMRTVGSGKYNNTYVEGVDINDNSVPAVTYFNLSGRVNVTNQVEVFGVINNLANKAPPIEPQNFNFPAISQLHDLVGRSFRIGVRFKLNR